MCAEIRALQDWEVSGIAASYNTRSGDLGGFVEQIAPGAFKRSLDSGADVKCTQNHSPDLLMGRTKNGTLRLQDSPQGLRFVCKLSPEISTHANLRAMIMRGDLDSCSFAFVVPPDGDSWQEENGGKLLRTLRNVDLQDISIVTDPAYPTGTQASARSAVPNYIATPAARPAPVVLTEAHRKWLQGPRGDEYRRLVAQELGEKIRRDALHDRAQETALLQERAAARAAGDFHGVQWADHKLTKLRGYAAVSDSELEFQRVGMAKAAMQRLGMQFVSMDTSHVYGKDNGGDKFRWAYEIDPITGALKMDNRQEFNPDNGYYQEEED